MPAIILGDTLISAESRPLVDYMHARYYNPNGGRFLSIDPSLNMSLVEHQPQAWNRYSYVNNNPMSHVDPDGRNPLGALIGGAIGISFESWKQVRCNCSHGWRADNRRLAGAFAGGAASGFIGGLGTGIKAAVLFGSLGGATGHVIEHGINGDKIRGRGLAGSAVAGSVGGAIGNMTGRLIVGVSSSSGTLNQFTLKAAAERADAAVLNAGLGADRETVRQAATVVRGLTGAGDAWGQTIQAKVDQELNDNNKTNRAVSDVDDVKKEKP